MEELIYRSITAASAVSHLPASAAVVFRVRHSCTAPMFFQSQPAAVVLVGRSKSLSSSFLQAREAKVRIPEDVGQYGSLLLKYYRSKLSPDECKCSWSSLVLLFAMGQSKCDLQWWAVSQQFAVGRFVCADSSILTGV